MHRIRGDDGIGQVRGFQQPREPGDFIGLVVQIQLAEHGVLARSIGCTVRSARQRFVRSVAVRRALGSRVMCLGRVHLGRGSTSLPPERPATSQRDAASRSRPADMQGASVGDRDLPLIAIRSTVISRSQDGPGLDGAKETRTPDPLLAKSAQGVQHCPWPGMTRFANPSESGEIRPCWCQPWVSTRELTHALVI
jgi:hypothetical protein